MKYNGFSIDTEADGFIFEAKNLWVLCLEDLDTDEKETIRPFEDPYAKEKLLNWVKKYDKPNISFHNGLGYDIFILLFVLGVEFTVGPDTVEGIPVNFVDTFYLSMFLNPDREAHGAEYWGDKLGFPKIDLREELIRLELLPDDAPDGAEFMQYTFPMEKYCQRDTLIGKLIFRALIKEWQGLYKTWDACNWPEHFRCGQKSFFLMSCQELTGWKFDKQAGIELKAKIEGMMEEIRASVEPQLPPRSLKKTEEKFYTLPAKPFKKDGTLSSTMEKWIEKHSAVVNEDKTEVTAYGKTYPIEPGLLVDVTLPMEMGNQDQMKEWFLASGWRPTLFNYQKDSNGKPIRDDRGKLIPTSPKIQEQGKLCPNLEKMEGDLVKQVVKWLSLRNRLAVLEGWLANPRLDYDGRIGAGRTGIASTHRQKHKVVVNVPKADPKVLLGYEFRSLWIAEEGMLIAAGDAAALEGRVMGHYTWKYDSGSTAKELLEGDVHCFSQDTEILTEAGWRTFDNLQGLKVAQWSDGLVEFVEPMDIIWKPYKGEMISFTSSSLDKLVTPNHRVLLHSYKNPDKSYVTFAKDVSNSNADLRIPTSGTSLGDDLPCAVIALIAATQSDAHITPSGALRFEFKKARKVSRLEQALEDLGIPYALNCGETTRFYISNEHVSFIFNYVSTSRNLLPSLLKISATSGRLLLEEFGFWDGTFKQNGDVVLDTTSSETVTILQAIAAKSGIKTAVTRSLRKVTTFGNAKVDRIYISMKSEPQVRTYKTKAVVEYSGMVGCVTVPSGFVVVKRNDKVCISGNSKNAFAFYGSINKEVRDMYQSPTFDKEDPNWKPFRNKSKNGFYAILYGAAGPKVASTLGIPESYGKEALDAFWLANPGTAALKVNLEKYWESAGQKKYLPAIDGRILMTRKKSALLNTIFQSCGGIVMDYAGVFMDKWLGGIRFDSKRRPYYVYKGCIVRRIGYFHDELEYECEEPVAEEVAKMIEHAIATAGKYLKLSVPLAGEGKVGINWKEVH